MNKFPDPEAVASHSKPQATTQMEGYLERIRSEELACVRPHFEPWMRVLELGAGSGFQASVLSSWGCRVTAVDIRGRPPVRAQYFPVVEYDGGKLPFTDASFDVAFSSNVLEHVKQLPRLFDDVRRVLVPAGRAVHIVPTPAWRLWTSLAHYGYLVKFLLGMREVASVAGAPSASEIMRRRGLPYLIRRAVIAGPHGEYPSALSELYYYSRRRWNKVFTDNQFAVLKVDTTGLFYTGYTLFPSLGVAARKRMARYLGSACHIFVLRASQSSKT